MSKKFLIAAALVVASMAAQAGVACTKIGFEPGTPDPNRCVPVVFDGAGPTVPPNVAVSPSVSATADAGASASLTDASSTRSVVAVFPPSASTPGAPSGRCVLTNSIAGGVLFNAATYAETTQRPDPVCVLMWLIDRAPSDERRAELEVKLFQQLGI